MTYLFGKDTYWDVELNVIWVPMTNLLKFPDILENLGFIILNWIGKSEFYDSILQDIFPHNNKITNNQI